MDRTFPRIAKRLSRPPYPTAYDPCCDADREVCTTITTHFGDHTRKGAIVIFEHDER